MPYPSASIIYEIYRSCLEDLGRCGLIIGSSFDVISDEPCGPETPLKYICEPADTLTLPDHGEMLISYSLFPDSIPKQLSDIAETSTVSRTRLFSSHTSVTFFAYRHMVY